MIEAISNPVPVFIKKTMEKTKKKRGGARKNSGPDKMDPMERKTYVQVRGIKVKHLEQLGGREVVNPLVSAFLEQLIKERCK